MSRSEGGAYPFALSLNHLEGDWREVARVDQDDHYRAYWRWHLEPWEAQALRSWVDDGIFTTVQARNSSDTMILLAARVPDRHRERFRSRPRLH